jgi:hypothetical protein
MVEFVPMRIQACFNVPQTLPSRNLGVCQAKELIESGKGFSPMFPSISAYAEIKIVPGEKLKQLPENIFAGIHRCPPKVLERVSPVEIEIENEKFCQRTLEINYLQPLIQILPDSSEEK